jgi:hypothetical protein
MSCIITPPPPPPITHRVLPRRALERQPPLCCQCSFTLWTSRNPATTHTQCLILHSLPSSCRALRRQGRAKQLHLCCRCSFILWTNLSWARGRGPLVWCWRPQGSWLSRFTGRHASSASHTVRVRVCVGVEGGGADRPGAGAHKGVGRADSQGGAQVQQAVRCVSVWRHRAKAMHACVCVCGGGWLAEQIHREARKFSKPYGA